ncbi:hypothetical protein BY996DRAFT_4587027 [Phakopsora pachyrhizi]|uniref:Expressed protein n=1 Tax=Phakopsora pachyrhizi TaxID=170000 RepID=A0AAV0AQ98_PHAPC|nr:hypothetical protein BY996DRAFT_4596114 [Phakopsora pachyrhizi]KAI8450721.1 hypothetical protein BY996DRAFT_4587027 [Phakopsora pachyrhizi]CAH7669615.1 expressed protein [Phakopsora pachyrhizi]
MVPDFLRFNNKSSSSRRSKRSDKVNLKDHYCCFAIPLYNVGIYSILTEFFIIGTVFGILSFSAPSILAVALPGILTSLFGFICLMIGMSQAAGFYGVYMEKVELFEKYVIVNVVLLLIGLVYSLVLMIISATRHDTATEECIIQFVSGDERSSVSESGRSVCDVWTWAQLAVCGILWFITGLSQLYFCHLQRVWSRDQKLDHLHYRTIVSAARDSMLGTNSQARGDPRSDAEDWETDSRVGSLDLNRVIREENVIQNSHQASSKQSSQRSNMKNSSRLKNQIGERTVAEEEEERLVAGSTLVSRVV